MSQAFKKRKIRGQSPLVQKKVIHPISGREMFVAVYRINPYLAEMALKLKANSVQLSNEARAKSDQIGALNDQLNRGVVPLHYDRHNRDLLLLLLLIHFELSNKSWASSGRWFWTKPVKIN